MDRIKASLEAVREIAGRVWPWMQAAIAAGALINAYALAELQASIMERDAMWCVSGNFLSSSDF